ncbi:hypothetical protein BKA93DRAFT_789126 [Sparassis latifolia]
MDKVYGPPIVPVHHRPRSPYVPRNRGGHSPARSRSPGRSPRRRPKSRSVSPRRRSRSKERQRRNDSVSFSENSSPFRTRPHRLSPGRLTERRSPIHDSRKGSLPKSNTSDNVAIKLSESPVLAAARVGDAPMKKGTLKIVMPAATAPEVVPMEVVPRSITNSVKAEAQPDPVLTAEDKRKTWATRIEILSTATTVRAEREMLDRDLRDLSRLVGSSHFTSLPEEEQTRVQAHVSDLETRRAAREAELKRTVSALAEVDDLPALATEQPPSNTELVTQIEELRSSVAQLSELLQTVSARVHAGGVRAEQGSSTPAKRRKLSTDGSGSDAPTLVEAAELDEMRQRMDSLEQSLAGVENNVNTLYGDMSQEVTALREEMAQNAAARRRSPSLSEGAAQRLESLEKEVTTTGEEIAELAQEVGGLIRDRGTMLIESERLKLENHELKKQIEELQGSYKTSMETMRKEISVLNAAVILRLAQPPPATITTCPWDVDQILDAVRPSLTAFVQTEVQPLLDGLRNSVQELLAVHDAQFCGMMASKLAVTLQAAEAMRTWLDRVGMGALGTPANANGLGQH